MDCTTRSAVAVRGVRVADRADWAARPLPRRSPSLICRRAGQRWIQVRTPMVRASHGFGSRNLRTADGNPPARHDLPRSPPPHISDVVAGNRRAYRAKISSPTWLTYASKSGMLGRTIGELDVFRRRWTTF